MIDNTPWGLIKQVKATAIPSNRNSKYQRLITDILLRLEQTKPGFALEIPFESRSAMVGANTALRTAFKNTFQGQPPPTIKKVFNTDGNGGTLYVIQSKTFKPKPLDPMEDDET